VLHEFPFPFQRDGSLLTVVRKIQNPGRRSLKTDVSPVLQDTEHADVLTVGLSVDGVERMLDLRLNTDLIPVGYQQRYQRRGTYEVHSPSRVVSTLEIPSRSLRATPLTAWPQTMLVKSITSGGGDGFYRIHRIARESEAKDSFGLIGRHASIRGSRDVSTGT